LEAKQVAILLDQPATLDDVEQRAHGHERFNCYWG
jgi:hypothetical protein